MKMNNRGQFSIVAALLVAVILVATVISTYSAIRYSTVQDQPQVLTAVDETNLALKQLLGYTVGYYGSILQVTGNATYAREDTQYGAKSYLHKGLQNIVDMHPEWGLSLNVTSIDLSVDWFSTSSYSSGEMSVKYDLAGLGLYGITYAPQCRLDVEVLPSVSGSPARVRLLQDEEEPLNTLTLQNFKFYNYSNSDQIWNLVDPPNEPEVSSNGTYTINVPFGIDSSLYLIQVKDDRGLMVVGSSFNSYDSTFTSDATSSGQEHYIDQTSNVDGSADKGNHNPSLDPQKAADSQIDTLTEGLTSQDLTLRPSGTGSIEELDEDYSWLANWECVDESSSDGDNSYVYNGISITYRSDLYQLQNHGSETGTINSVRVFVNARKYANDPDNSYAETYLRVGSTNTYGAENVLTGSYQVYSSVYTTKPGGGSWTWADIDTLQAGVRLKSGDIEGSYVSIARCTQVWVEVNYTPTNYVLDLEEQFTSVDPTQTSEYLCIYAGALNPDESLQVDVRSGSNWVPVISALQPNQWNNVSVSPWLTSSTFTIRFKGTEESGDLTQDSWQIDAVLLRLTSAPGLLPVQDSTIVIEWLQNGTMRWLGQNLDLTTEAKPIPPIPVRAIHLNQTFTNGTSREVPFQVEDWVADYSIPLGLTSSVTIFSNRQMVVFILTSEVVEVTMWWDGSDTATQTPLAYTNTIFTQDDPNNGFLSNGILSLTIGSGFSVNSTKGSSTSTAKFMRINNEGSVYGAGEAAVIHHGIVRDVVQQEAEWGTAGSGGGADGCPNIYANIVLTLPAGASYYTYQLKLMFIDSSTNPRTITDFVPLQLYTSPSSPIAQTENGTIGSSPRVANGTGTFRDDSGSGSTKHHWSQIINTGTGVGAGIMFTELANQRLYFFDSIAGGSTGALNVSSTAKTIELAPVTSLHTVSNYNTPSGAEVTWYGAVATFDGSTSPIYDFNDGSPVGLWMLIEYLPMATVTAER